MEDDQIASQDHARRVLELIEGLMPGSAWMCTTIDQALFWVSGDYQLIYAPVDQRYAARYQEETIAVDVIDEAVCWLLEVSARGGVPGEQIDLWEGL